MSAGGFIVGAILVTVAALNGESWGLVIVTLVLAAFCIWKLRRFANRYGRGDGG